MQQNYSSKELIMAQSSVLDKSKYLGKLTTERKRLLTGQCESNEGKKSKDQSAQNEFIEVNVLRKASEDCLDLALSIFMKSAVLEKCGVSKTKLRRFLIDVKAGYRNNAYHNWHHAVHVLQNSFRFIQHSQDLLSPNEKLLLLVAAVCHGGRY